MAGLKYKTRGNSSPQGKPRVYFCCLPEEFNKYFESISDEILVKQNCAIWYNDETIVRDKDFFADLKQMQLFVMPVTTNLLCTENEVLDTEFKFAIENHIPVLPLMQENGLEELFNKKCGDLQFLDKNNADVTAISYDEKLKKYLESVLIGDELAEKIRAAFDAYVFLSYRKIDRKYAQELMRLIHKNEFCRDIAIWYDEFLTPGENFNDSIKEALKKSGLFVLTVTPNLVNEPNYIMTTEYPMAKQEGKPILPAELVPTDREQLSEKYEDIPNPADAHNESELSEALLESIKKMAIKENDNSPEHNFFIGLAYLGGIDVEVDCERAMLLITSAAEAGLVEAMKKLVTMYQNGSGTKKSAENTIRWQKDICRSLRATYKQSSLENDAETLIKEIFNLGDILSDFDFEESSLKAYIEGMNLSKKCCDKFKSTHSHILLANSYEKMGDAVGKCEREIADKNNCEERDKYYFKSLSLCKEILSREDIHELKWNICRIYIKIGLCRAFGMRLSYFKSAQDMAMELDCKTIAEKQILQRIYLKLAKTYGEPWAIESHIDDAHICFQECITLAKSIEEEFNTIDAKRALAVSYMAYGNLYRDLLLFDTAREYYHKSLILYLDFAKNIDDVQALDELSAIYYCIATVDKKNIDFGLLEKAHDFISRLVEKYPQNSKYLFKKDIIERNSVRTLIIPENATEIEFNAYSNYVSILKVDIPNSVTKIGGYAFAKCLSLESVNLPNGVTEIGISTFSDCSSLMAINIPNSVTSIGWKAFARCSALSSVVLSEGVTEIGIGVFCDCSSLTSINIPDNVTCIGREAFARCSALSSMVLPDSVTEICIGAFGGCRALKRINVPNGVTEIMDETFWGCNALSSINIPKGVTKIGESAFINCTSLTTIEIPTSVSNIGDDAFKDCTGLISIMISRRFEDDIIRIFGDIDYNIINFID